MMRMVTWSALTLALVFAGAAQAQQTIEMTCRCDGRSFEATCPGDKVVQCKCEEQKFSCDAPIKQSSTKDQPNKAKPKPKPVGSSTPSSKKQQ